MVLFLTDGETVEADIDAVGLESGTCERPARRLGEATSPRSMIGADTITADLSYSDGELSITGTLTLIRVN